MKTVHKFHVNPPGQQTKINIPPGAAVVHFGLQHGERFMWVEVNIAMFKIGRTFEVYGTGWDIPDTADHRGTLIDAGGFVWHLYEHAEAPDGQPT